MDFEATCHGGPHPPTRFFSAAKAAQRPFVRFILSFRSLAAVISTELVLCAQQRPAKDPKENHLGSSRFQNPKMIQRRSKPQQPTSCSFSKTLEAASCPKPHIHPVSPSKGILDGTKAQLLGKVTSQCLPKT